MDKTSIKSYSGNKPFLFISYSHNDIDTVTPIIAELHKRGVLFWYDEGIHIGEVWSQKIADRILNCSKVLLFISPNSMESTHVQQEINFANSKGKQILPVYIAPTQLSIGMEMTLSVYQAVFYYNSDKDVFFTKLIHAIGGGDEEPQGNTTDVLTSGNIILRRDEYGDPELPAIIDLTNVGTYSIGRCDTSLGVKQNDFEFPANKKNISRRHAVYQNNSHGFFITDWGSKAGTWVNGVKIPSGEPTQIISGDQIAFGTAGASYIFEMLVEVR